MGPHIQGLRYNVPGKGPEFLVLLMSPGSPVPGKGTGSWVWPIGFGSCLWVPDPRSQLCVPSPKSHVWVLSPTFLVCPIGTCLKVCNFIKKRLQHRRFPVNIAKYCEYCEVANNIQLADCLIRCNFVLNNVNCVN